MPNDAHQLLAQATSHQRAGRIPQAEQLYEQVLRLMPAQVDALHFLGVMAHQRGHREAAVEKISRAVTFSAPRTPPAFFNSLGVALRACGRLEEAVRNLQEAVSLNSNYAEAHLNLGATLHELGNLVEAAAACRRSLELKRSPRGLYALATVLRQQGDIDDAEDLYRQVLAMDSDHMATRTNLGAILKERGQLEAAADQYKIVLAANPSRAQAHYNLGIVMQEMGATEAALTHYRRAIDIEPAYADAHWNEALLILASGDYRSGWEKYLWRRRRPRSGLREFPQPEWDGAELAGQTLLIHAEQGLGDTIQFIRYAAMAKTRCGRVVVECQAGLARILRSVPGIDTVVTRGEPIPPFDIHVPLLSLPHLFGTEINTVPSAVPYIGRDVQLADEWSRRLGQTGRRNIGIVWRGNPRNSDDRKRSIAAETLAPLMGAPYINWFSLQLDATDAEIHSLSGMAPVTPLGKFLISWDETAALLTVLDLVITVDTAVAHLAGALGCPTWVLLAKVPHWVWMRDREDTPWYPRTRLFRQDVRGDWDPVIARVLEAL